MVPPVNEKAATSGAALSGQKECRIDHRDGSFAGTLVAQSVRPPLAPLTFSDVPGKRVIGAVLRAESTRPFRTNPKRGRTLLKPHGSENEDPTSLMFEQT